MFPLDKPLYPIAQAGKLARNVSLNTLRSQFQSGLLNIDREIDAPAVAGGTRKLSARRVLQIVIMVELTSLGVVAARAARLAFGFTDVAQGAGPDNGMTQRIPGELFPDAWTYLVAHEDSEWPRVVRVLPTTPVLQLLYHPGHGRMRPAVVLPLDDIVNRTIAALKGDTGLND